MTKKQKPIVAKDDLFDDVDPDFAFSDDNFDIIIDDLDRVNEYLKNDERLTSRRRYIAENREIVNQRQREWRQQDPERVRQYNQRRDKDAERAGARKRYKLHAEQERERQRIIREKRRAQKAATKADDSVTKASKIKSGSRVLKDKDTATLKKLKLENENM